MSKALAEILVKDRVITQTQFQEAYESKHTKGIIYALIEKRFLAEAKLVQYLSQKFRLNTINLAKYDIAPDLIKTISGELARKLGVIPVSRSKESLVVALADPTGLINLEDLKYKTKLNVEAVLCSFSALEAGLSKYYSGTAVASTAIDAFNAEAAKTGENYEVDRQQAIEVDEASVDEAPVITLVNNILVEAIKRGASDIHIESYEKRSRVRFRVDGFLQEAVDIPPNMRRPVIARLKIMSKMDIAESRIPQDGRIKIKLSNQEEVDFRVSSMPCLFGEKMVLRLLTTGNLSYDLERLGFEKSAHEKFRNGIYQPNGMVLVTGPTGSGKTTTLYSALAELNKLDTNVSTAEDPVEYNFDGINQCQVNKDIGLSFAAVLRTFLRQDPDVILVGEIRDFETAEVAIQAALTGHLVLSTLHTNDAPSTVLRLMNMGVESFLVASSVNTIVAQRLLRRICSKCKVEIKIPPEQLLKLGLKEEAIKRGKLFKGKGCEVCSKSGYKGRVAVYEVMDISTSIKELILAGGTALELKRLAVKEGMTTLRMSALNKVLDGITTLEEAVSVTASE